MAKAILEVDGKALLAKHFKGLVLGGGAGRNLVLPCRSAPVKPDTDLDILVRDYPWLQTERLVVKPDQLIKRRGNLGLVYMNSDLSGVREWLSSHMEEELQVDMARGTLRRFLIEPFVPHEQREEFYVSIVATRLGNVVMFHHEGGVEVGDVDVKAERVEVDIDKTLSAEQAHSLVAKAPEDTQTVLVEFLQLLYKAYSDLYFTYLEINPLVIKGNTVHILDLAAKLDSTAEFLCKAQWGDLAFPPPFGREALPEEAYIADLDAKSGASLKLTVLNSRGRIWTMVAGGGASVIYSDTICDLGGGQELANYGEYSGAPSESQTFEYAKTILSLMTKEKHMEGLSPLV